MIQNDLVKRIMIKFKDTCLDVFLFVKYLSQLVIN